MRQTRKYVNAYKKKESISPWNNRAWNQKLQSYREYRIQRIRPKFYFLKTTWSLFYTQIV